MRQKFLLKYHNLFDKFCSDPLKKISATILQCILVMEFLVNIKIKKFHKSLSSRKRIAFKQSGTFFGTSHGKNACDGVGGTTKTEVMKRSLGTTWLAAVQYSSSYGTVVS